MAVITLSPNRWAQLGAGLGDGVSAGLVEALAEQARQQQQQEAIRQQAQELASLAQVLGVQIPQGFQPQTPVGLDVYKQLIAQQTAPEEAYTLAPGQVRYQGGKKVAEVPVKEAYTLGPGQVRYQGGKKVAEVPAKEEAYTLGPGQARYQGGKMVARVPAKENIIQIPYYDKSGKKRMKAVPESRLEEVTNRIIESGGSLMEPMKPEFTPGEALRRLSDIQKAKATLEQTNEITSMIVAANPELADMIGQKINPELKQQLMDQWQNEIDYLNEFIPQQYKKAPEPLYEYTPGKGLRKVR